MITLSDETTDSFEVSGTESAQALTLVQQRSPDTSSDGASGRIVFQAPSGQRLDEPANRQVIAASLKKISTGHVGSVDDPFEAGTVSADGQVAFADVSFTVPTDDLSAADRDALSAASTAAEDGGLFAVVGGSAAEEAGAPPIAELIGLVVGFFVLALTFGSLVAAGMPLITAVVGVGIGFTSIGLLSGFVAIGSTTPALGVMLGLAVGIDYALFIMSRYRHEVAEGRHLPDAMGRAVGTAGSAVIFAGLTVVIALVGLSVCGVGFLSQLGLAAAGMVALSVVIALTLLPAMLGLAGHRVTSPKLPFLKKRQSDQGRRTNGRRWIETVARVPRTALVGGVALAAVAAIPVLSMQLALPGAATDPSGSDTRVAYDLVAKNFGAGANGPLVVVVDTASSSDPAAAVVQATTELESIPRGIASIQSPLSRETPQALAALQQQTDAVGFATITVVPTSAPTAPDTKNLVTQIRATLDDLPAKTGARAMVTGQTAVDVDIVDELNSVFPIYLAIVIGLAFVLLVVVFRSILVPLKAALGFLLSVGVALGATVAVFQWGWLSQMIGLDTTSPILFLLPLMLTGILFGLAMDYEVFLVSRMREAYAHGAPATQAVLDGFAHSARVVTAAAVIMIGVFAGFALIDDVTLKTIGFGLAVGVLADAFIVRMTIVPAVMLLVGDRMWWMPNWLSRILPNLDIEGEELTRRLDPALELATCGATSSS
ncbi:MMPL family transporter [Solicola sp. PLA-1-18]|uniref:MMPL family transporter n=1 Tax=Solicola sp. PLA-1-18 TaxID=3380532 RepID=UPI003B7D608C